MIYPPDNIFRLDELDIYLNLYGTKRYYFRICSRPLKKFDKFHRKINVDVCNLEIDGSHVKGEYEGKTVKVVF